MAGISSTIMFVAMAAAAVVKGVSSYQQAKAQSKALAREGEIRAKERDEKTRRLAASQKASFLSSGISLSGEEDTTTGFYIGETYTKGLEDVGQIKSNYNAAIKDTMASGRMALIGGLLQGAGHAFGAMGSFGGKGAMGGTGITDTGQVTSWGRTPAGYDMNKVQRFPASGYGITG